MTKDWFKNIQYNYVIDMPDEYVEVPNLAPLENYVGERKVNQNKLKKRRARNKAARKARKK